MTYKVLGKLKAYPHNIVPIRENIAELKEAELEVVWHQSMKADYSEITIEED